MRPSWPRIRCLQERVNVTCSMYPMYSMTMLCMNDMPFVARNRCLQERVNEISLLLFPIRLTPIETGLTGLWDNKESNSLCLASTSRMRTSQFDRSTSLSSPLMTVWPWPRRCRRPWWQFDRHVAPDVTTAWWPRALAKGHTHLLYSGRSAVDVYDSGKYQSLGRSKELLFCPAIQL